MRKILVPLVMLLMAVVPFACTQREFPTVPSFAPGQATPLVTSTPTPATSYVYALQFGSLGMAVSQFYFDPTIIAVGGSDVFVTDGYSGIHVFDFNGNFVSRWSLPVSVTYNAVDYQLGGAGPNGIMVADGANNLYLLAPLESSPDFQEAVIKFSSTGTLLNDVGLHDANVVYGGDTGIAVGSSGNVFVVGSNVLISAPASMYFVQELNSSLTPVTVWGTLGTGPGQFQYPNGIAVDSSDNVYVNDFPRVQKFNSNGTYLGQIGAAGTGYGQWINPKWITSDGSNIYLYDPSVFLIKKYNSSGTFLTQFGGYGTGNGQFLSSNGIGADSAGDIFLIDEQDFRVEKFHP